MAFTPTRGTPTSGSSFTPTRGQLTPPPVVNPTATETTPVTGKNIFARISNLTRKGTDIARTWVDKNPIKTAGEDIAKIMPERGKKGEEILQRVIKGDIHPLVGSVGLVGQGLGAAGDAIGAAVKPVAEPVMKGIYDTSVRARSLVEPGTVSEIKARDLQDAAVALKAGQETWDKFSKQHPNSAELLNALGNTIMFGLNFAGTGEAVKGVEAGAETGIQAAKLAAETAADTASAVKTGVQGAANVPIKAITRAASAATDSKPGAVVKRVASDVKGAVQRTGARIGEYAAESKAMEGLAPSEKAVRKVGFDEGFVEGIKQLPKDVHAKGLEMLDIAEKSAKSGGFATKQPKEVVGRAITDAMQPVLKARDRAGKELEAIRKTFSTKKELDATRMRDDLVGEIIEKGATYDEKSGLLEFPADTRIPESDRKIYQDVLDALRPDTNGNVFTSQKSLDNISRRFFKEYNLAAERQQPFSDEAISFVDSMRSKTGDLLGPQFKAASTEYAQVMKFLRDAAKVLRPNGRLNPETITGKALKASEVAMRNLGNARATNEEFFNALKEMAAQYGSKEVEHLDALVRMADIVEHLVGSSQTRGLEGAMARGTAATQSALMGGVEGLKSGGIPGAIGGVIQKIGGLTSEDQIKALREFLSHLSR